MQHPQRPVFVHEVGHGTGVRDDLWDPVILAQADLEAEVQRLAALDPPADGRRRSLIVHPRSQGPGAGLAPGIEVALDVLLPGERTAPRRHNSSMLTFSIQGGSTVEVDRRTFELDLHDVVYVPALGIYSVVNHGTEPCVRLTYSNAPVLEKLRVHWVDDDPSGDTPTVDDPTVEPTVHPIADAFPLSDDGAHLMSYEKLINPDPVVQRPLHWRWSDVRHELDKLAALGAKYRGRRLYLLYNPATGRTNGTTPSFFATLTVRPPNIVDRPHRHASAAINYFFSGSGWSRVGGRRYEWAAGDLMLSAPGWAIHNHASNDEPVYELTVQDSPFHIANDSLMWQEDLKRPAILLGSHPGWETNRADLEAPT
jgi:gentisate 1,2-dioxygenase